MPDYAIFINYRRSDSSGYAGRLRDHLVTQFGRDRVFIDVGIRGRDHSVRPGSNKPSALQALCS